MKKLFSFISLAIVLWSCGGSGDDNVSKKIAKGPVFYGGVLRVNEVEDFKNLFPLSYNDITSHHIASQVYEGLVRLNEKDLSLQPSLAEKWSVSADAKTFTFELPNTVLLGRKL